MGDEILRYIILILPIIFASSLIQASEEIKPNSSNENIAEYDKLFSQISQKRVGVSNDEISMVKNPFIMTNKIILKDTNTTVAKIKYILEGTLNKKAKINGKWYTINDKIDGYKLVVVKRNSVIIKNEHLKKELFIRKNNVSKIKFSSK